MNSNNETTQTQGSRSFLERFTSLENAVSQHDEALVLVMQSLQKAASQQADNNTSMQALAEAFGALIGLLKDGAQVSEDALAARIVQNQSDELKKQLDSLVAQGELLPAEEILSEDNDFTFEVEGKIPFAFGSVKQQDPAVRSTFVGKKAGDLVNDMKILAVYKRKSKAMNGEENVQQEKSEEKAN